MNENRWLSNVAKSGDYNDLLNKIEVVTDIDSMSETDAASARSVKMVYDKATEAINNALLIKKKISDFLNSIGIETSEDITFDDLIEKIKDIFVSSIEDASATPDKIIEGKTAYTKDGKIIGTIKKHEQISEGLDVSHKDGKLYCEIEKGAYIPSEANTNPQITKPKSAIANVLNIRPEIIAKGNTICDVEGTAITESIGDNIFREIIKVSEHSVPFDESSNITFLNELYNEKYILFYFCYNIDENAKKFYKYDIQSTKLEEMKIVPDSFKKSSLNFVDDEFIVVGFNKYDFDLHYTETVDEVVTRSIDGKDIISISKLRSNSKDLEITINEKYHSSIPLINIYKRFYIFSNFAIYIPSYDDVLMKIYDFNNRKEIYEIKNYRIEDITAYYKKSTDSVIISNGKCTLSLSRDGKVTNIINYKDEEIDISNVVSSLSYKSSSEPVLCINRRPFLMEGGNIISLNGEFLPTNNVYQIENNIICVDLEKSKIFHYKYE